MIQIMADYWWIFLLIALLALVVHTAVLIKRRHNISAQFVEPFSFLGCFVLMFNVIGIISAILSILSGLIKLGVIAIL